MSDKFKFIGHFVSVTFEAGYYEKLKFATEIELK
jgi:hypothetical protein